MVKPGDSLSDLVLRALPANHITLQNGDVLVLAQKVVSKSEGRLVNLAHITPSQRAKDLAVVSGKDARFIELVLQESREVLRVRPGTIIVEHHNGFVCANAGIDHSNVRGEHGQPEDWVLLLPEDGNISACHIRNELELASNTRLGVLVIDSHGRAWRNGTVGISIGMSGMPGLVDLRGRPDLFGFHLQVTQVGAADELAAAASLVMGQASEGLPVVHVRGFPYPLREGELSELIRARDLDMFR